MSEQVPTKDLSITKEGIRVEVGQLWRDLDVRMLGRVRQIVAVDAINGKVTMGWPDGAECGRTRVSVRRMHKHATGWSLVR